jgi:hypothetical protein
VEQDPEGVKTSGGERRWMTACGYAGGTKLWRVAPRADPAWNKAGRLRADEGARRL